MSRRIRIGVEIERWDPFWVQVREAVFQHAQMRGVEAVLLDVDFPVDDPLRLIEELQAQEIDAVVCVDWGETLSRDTLELGIPIVQLTESDLRHPLFVAPLGLYNIAKDIGKFLAQKLAGQGRVLAVGGLMQHVGEDGKSRIAGLTDALLPYPNIDLLHIPCAWNYDSACRQMRSAPWGPGDHFDAVFGLSDSCALGGRDVGHELGLIDSRTVIVGINGDPLALAAIVDGSMTATVETTATDMAEQAVDLACQAAQRQLLPASFS